MSVLYVCVICHCWLYVWVVFVLLSLSMSVYQYCMSVGPWWLLNVVLLYYCSLRLPPILLRSEVQGESSWKQREGKPPRPYRGERINEEEPLRILSSTVLTVKLTECRGDDEALRPILSPLHVRLKRMPQPTYDKTTYAPRPPIADTLTIKLPPLRE